MKSFLPVIDNVLELYDKPKFLIILDHFEGWEASAVWTDLKYGLEHRSEFGPMGIVGDNTAQKWMTQFTDVFVPSEIRYFSEDEEQQARDWLAAQDSKNTKAMSRRTTAGG